MHLGCTSFIRYTICKYFLPGGGLSSCCLNGVPERQKFFIPMTCPFSFGCHAQEIFAYTHIKKSESSELQREMGTKREDK